VRNLKPIFNSQKPNMFKQSIAASALFLTASLLSIQAGAAERVFFQSPLNNATVTSPVKLSFGLEGMKIAPLGDMAEKTGHHHVIIDGAPIKVGASIPADDTHIHFGKGQQEAEIKLTPGKHTLTMQFGNGVHQSYGEGMSQTITVNVEAAK
jgi:hypothetical protein